MEMYILFFFIGKSWPDKFTKVEIIKEVPFDSELGGVWSLQYSFDGETLAVGYGNGGIRVCLYYLWSWIYKLIGPRKYNSINIVKNNKCMHQLIT